MFDTPSNFAYKEEAKSVNSNSEHYSTISSNTIAFSEIDKLSANVVKINDDKASMQNLVISTTASSIAEFNCSANFHLQNIDSKIMIATVEEATMKDSHNLDEVFIPNGFIYFPYYFILYLFTKLIK
jgi:hypothetical protein